jgi:hypothetical protein
MNMLHTQTDLSEPIKNLLFCKWASSLLLDSLPYISSIRVLHDDMHPILLCLVHLDESHDIGVIQGLKDLSFLDGFLSFLRTHTFNVHLFNYKLSLEG